MHISYVYVCNILFTQGTVERDPCSKSHTTAVPSAYFSKAHPKEHPKEHAKEHATSNEEACLRLATALEVCVSE